MLNVNPPGIRSGKISDKFLKWRWILKWVF
jgi:hypothetical protein